MSGTIRVIRLGDELEIGRRAEVASALVVEGTEKAILLDFADVRYADSTALSELMRFRSEAEARAIPVAILIGNRQFKRLIQYAGLSEAFAIFEERSAALTDLSRRMK